MLSWVTQCGIHVFFVCNFKFSSFCIFQSFLPFTEKKVHITRNCLDDMKRIIQNEKKLRKQGTISSSRQKLWNSHCLFSMRRKKLIFYSLHENLYNISSFGNNAKPNEQYILEMSRFVCFRGKGMCYLESFE